MRSYSYPFDFSKFGCRVNALSVEDLFGAYEAAGFIYRAKRAVLEPYYSIVTANWRAALDARLLYVFSYGNVDDPPWASVTSWMHTTRGWNTQHLVGIGGPIASRDRNC